MKRMIGEYTVNMKSGGAATRESLLTATEVAERLSVSRKTVYAWAAQGHLPCVVLAEGVRKRCMRFEPAVLERWIQERQVDSVVG